RQALDQVTGAGSASSKTVIHNALDAVGCHGAIKVDLVPVHGYLQAIDPAGKGRLPDETCGNGVADFRAKRWVGGGQCRERAIAFVAAERIVDRAAAGTGKEDLGKVRLADVAGFGGAPTQGVEQL